MPPYVEASASLSQLKEVFIIELEKERRYTITYVFNAVFEIHSLSRAAKLMIDAVG